MSTTSFDPLLNLACPMFPNTKSAWPSRSLSELALAQVSGEVVRVGLVAYGDRGDRLEVVGNRVELLRLFHREACHLMHAETERRRLKAELRSGETHIVQRMPIRFAVVRERLARHREQKHIGTLGPALVPLVQARKQPSELGFVLSTGDDESPRLLVETGVITGAKVIHFQRRQRDPVIRSQKSVTRCCPLFGVGSKPKIGNLLLSTFWGGSREKQRNLETVNEIGQLRHVTFRRLPSRDQPR